MSATLVDWIRQEAISFSADSPESFNTAVDRLVASLACDVELLGFGEPMHGEEGFLKLRNQFFQRLVEAHGYTAIAVESSFPRGKAVNEFVGGRGEDNYESIQEAGFSHGFGASAANRELVEWMRKYNADPAHSVKLRFYGFDSPTEMMNSDSPRQVLTFALDYLASVDPAGEKERRERIDSFIGNDADWENSEANMDPTKGIGQSPAAMALRIETEDLITELRRRQPELVAKSDNSRFQEALHDAALARQLLTYHAAVARASENRLAELLGQRDLMMADNLESIVSSERGRGKVLAFAHNSHLKCGQAEWQWGPNRLIWWPAGAHIEANLGPRYAVIGIAVGTSETHGIAAPEAGTLEALLTAAPGPMKFVPTHKGQAVPASAIAAMPTRSGSQKNPGYFPLTPQSLTEYDWLMMLDSIY